MIVAWRILGYKELDMAERLSLFLLKGFRICHVKICHFGIEVTLSQRQLRGNRCRREFLCTTPICWRKGRLPTPVFLDFPGGSAGKESASNLVDLGSILGLERSPGEETGYPLQYSGLENSMDCIVHGVTKSQTRLSDFHFT